MLKYTMIIDNENYTALFEDHFVAADFLDTTALDSEVVVVKYEEVTIDDILADSDFEYSYKIEMIGSMEYPNIKFNKVAEIEALLKKAGVI